MLVKLLFTAALASSVISKHVPRYADLDEEDQELFRAAYDAPYEQEEYHEEEEAPGKLDLLKDGMWALKTKIKEMKIFHKALAAHLLATKLQVKELLMTLKKHHHGEVEKKKPVYHYQSQPPPAYHQYEPPHYTATPSEQYGPQHASPQYGPPQHAPSKYEPPAPPKHPQLQYEAHLYAAPPQPQQYDHDPYYGY